MDVSEKKSTKVASQLPWKPKSIENIEKTFRTLEGRHRFKFLVTGQLTGMHLWWNTENKLQDLLK